MIDLVELDFDQEQRKHGRHGDEPEDTEPEGPVTHIRWSRSGRASGPRGRSAAGGVTRLRRNDRQRMALERGRSLRLTLVTHQSERDLDWAPAFLRASVLGSVSSVLWIQHPTIARAANEDSVRCRTYADATAGTAPAAS